MTCIAHRNDGKLCHKPAHYVDAQRGGIRNIFLSGTWRGQAGIAQDERKQSVGWQWWTLTIP